MRSRRVRLLTAVMYLHVRRRQLYDYLRMNMKLEFFSNKLYLLIKTRSIVVPVLMHDE